MRLILAFILITFISCSEPTSSTTSETENVIWAFNGSTSVPAAKITILNLNDWVEATQTSTVFSEFETSDTGHVDLGLLPNGRYSGFIEDDSLGLYFVFDVVDSLILDVDSLILEPYNTYEIHMPSQANSTIHLLGTPYEIQLNSEGAAYQQKIPMGHYPTAIYQGETLYFTGWIDATDSTEKILLNIEWVELDPEVPIEELVDLIPIEINNVVVDSTKLFFVIDDFESTLPKASYRNDRFWSVSSWSAPESEIIFFLDDTYNYPYDSFNDLGWAHAIGEAGKNSIVGDYGLAINYKSPSPDSTFKISLDEHISIENTSYIKYHIPCIKLWIKKDELTLESEFYLNISTIRDDESGPTYTKVLKATTEWKQESFCFDEMSIDNETQRLVYSVEFTTPKSLEFEFKANTTSFNKYYLDHIEYFAKFK